jgi:hypothetical protein
MPSTLEESRQKGRRESGASRAPSQQAQGRPARQPAGRSQKSWGKLRFRAKIGRINRAHRALSDSTELEGNASSLFYRTFLTPTARFAQNALAPFPKTPLDLERK